MARHAYLGRGLALFAALWLAACATPPQPAPDDDGTVDVPAQPRGRLKPMPIRPLSIKTDCAFKDEAGYAGSARLDIERSEVRDFNASVDVPRRGSCRFDMADFRQVRKEPHVELRAHDGCTVRMWEQGEQVTVAFTQCASRCSSGTFDYVWPILVDRPSGQCN